MSESQKPIVLVSGANGLLGTRLVPLLLEAGYQVRALVRKPNLKPWAELEVQSFSCDLPDTIDTNAFASNPKFFIHCAFTTQFENPKKAERANLEGSRRLIDLWRKASPNGCFVFISSMSAHDQAESLYGKHKLAVEQMLDLERKDVVIKPGFIVASGGLCGRICATIRRFPLIPMFYGGRQQIQVVDLDDLCRGVVASLSLGAGSYALASPEVLSVREFYKALARRVGRNAFFFPLPEDFVFRILQLFEFFGLSLGITTENLLGLKALRVFSVEKSWKLLGFIPKEARRVLEKPQQL